MINKKKFLLIFFILVSKTQGMNFQITCQNCKMFNEENVNLSKKIDSLNQQLVKLLENGNKKNNYQQQNNVVDNYEGDDQHTQEISNSKSCERCLKYEIYSDSLLQQLNKSQIKYKELEELNKTNSKFEEENFNFKTTIEILKTNIESYKKKIKDLKKSSHKKSETFFASESSNEDNNEDKKFTFEFGWFKDENSTRNSIDNTVDLMTKTLENVGNKIELIKKNVENTAENFTDKVETFLNNNMVNQHDKKINDRSNNISNKSNFIPPEEEFFKAVNNSSIKPAIDSFANINTLSEKIQQEKIEFKNKITELENQINILNKQIEHEKKIKDEKDQLESDEKQLKTHRQTLQKEDVGEKIHPVSLFDDLQNSGNLDCSLFDLTNQLNFLTQEKAELENQLTEKVKLLEEELQKLKTEKEKISKEYTELNNEWIKRGNPYQNLNRKLEETIKEQDTKIKELIEKLGKLNNLLNTKLKDAENALTINQLTSIIFFCLLCYILYINRKTIKFY